MTNEWNGYRKEEFEFDGRKAIIIFPDAAPNGKLAIKTEYWDAFPNAEIELVKAGFHLAFIKNKTRWCRPEDEDLPVKKKFMDFLVEKYSLNKKAVLVGMSCGGMIAVKLTALYPEAVSCLYLDAPVMNLLSCPAGIGVGNSEIWNEFNNLTGMSLSELINYRDNPVDKMSVLAANNIPIILVCGDSDMTVPYSENGKQLYDYYTKHKCNIKLILKPGCDHHPHGLDNPEEIVDFILQNS